MMNKYAFLVAVISVLWPYALICMVTAEMYLIVAIYGPLITFMACVLTTELMKHARSNHEK